MMEIAEYCCYDVKITKMVPRVRRAKWLRVLQQPLRQTTQRQDRLEHRVADVLGQAQLDSGERVRYSSCRPTSNMTRQTIPTSVRRWSASLLGLALATSAFAAKRPNIIIAMADDMGWSDIGCYGGEIDTPNLNTLAEGGVRFTQFYNTGRCCPTRASAAHRHLSRTKQGSGT